MAPTKSGWTKYGTDQIWLDQKWLRPNMGLEQIWVGPNMVPIKYAGPNLVRPKMADQKCLDQIWLDTKNCTILIILRVLCGEEPSRVRVIDVCKRFTSNLNYILLLSNNTANIFSTRKLNEVWVDSGGDSTMDLWGEKCFHLFKKAKIFANIIIVKHV